MDVIVGYLFSLCIQITSCFDALVGYKSAYDKNYLRCTHKEEKVYWCLNPTNQRASLA